MAFPEPISLFARIRTSCVPERHKKAGPGADEPNDPTIQASCCPVQEVVAVFET